MRQNCTLRQVRTRKGGDDFAAAGFAVVAITVGIAPIDRQGVWLGDGIYSNDDITRCFGQQGLLSGLRDNHASTFVINQRTINGKR